MLSSYQVTKGTSRLRYLHYVIGNFIVALCMPLVASADDAQPEFNTSFIHGSATPALVHALASGDDILPGRYPFDIYLNQTRVDHQEIEFRKASTAAPGYFCLTADQYRSYGIILPDVHSKSDCYPLTEHIAGSRITGNAAVQELHLVVPQTHLKPTPKGAIPTSVYDDGINAAFVNYAFSGSHARYKSNQAVQNNDYYFLSLNNGLNLGSWRLRNNVSLLKQSGQSEQWQTIANWAETDITPWRSRFQIGQSSTNNNVFDSIQFRGAQLSSVPEMLPDSRRGYAPVIRGVANSNARVEIRQNGYTVYSIMVPPGPFALTDVAPTTQSGDLAVTVIEADGARYQFIVPFSSVPNMLREGIWEYQLTAGKYHDGTHQYEPNFLQGTVSHGIAWDVTPYAGLLMADHYRSATVGVGKNMGDWGALSVDASWSDTDLASGASKRGASVHFLYAKSLNQYGTHFKIAGYRYSTSGFYTFADAVAERNNWQNGFYHTMYYDPDNNQTNHAPDWATESQRRRYYDASQYNNKRQRIEFTVNQSMTGASLYANFVRQNYWSTGAKDNTLQAGFNSMVNQISYNVFYQSSRSSYGYHDNSVNFNVSIPLSLFDHEHTTTINVNTSHSQQNGNGYSAGLSGSLLDDNRMNYFLQTGHSRYGGNTSLVNVGYLGSAGNIDLGYSYNNNYQQTSLDVSGGVVAHAGGITLSQPLQNTFVVVEAPGAQGVRLENQPGVAIDHFGHAIMTSATPYHHNRVALRATDIGNGLEIQQATKDIVPTYRAIGRVTFTTHLGHSLLIHAAMADGSEPVLGANMFNQQGQLIGVVGTRGDVYVAGVTSGETLQMKWGDAAQDSCTMTVPELPALDTQQPGGYQTVSLVCHLHQG